MALFLIWRCEKSSIFRTSNFGWESRKL